MHRIQNGWSADQAIQEANRYSISPLEFFLGNFIRRYEMHYEKSHPRLRPS
jgi:hypothetical protein